VILNDRVHVHPIREIADNRLERSAAIVTPDDVGQSPRCQLLSVMNMTFESRGDAKTSVSQTRQTPANCSVRRYVLPLSSSRQHAVIGPGVDQAFASGDSSSDTMVLSTVVALL
jgi:hypothetical protein